MIETDGCTYDGLARSFASGEPPGWLVAVIPEFVDILRQYAAAEREGPSRNELLDRLQATAEAARSVLAEVDCIERPMPRPGDPDGFRLYEILLNEGETALPHWSEIREGLLFLAQRAEEKAASWPDTRGKDKPFEELFRTRFRGPSAAVLCVLMTDLLWQAAHGGIAAGAHRTEAISACGALWNAADGARRGHAPGWRTNLVAARAFRDQPIGRALVEQIEKLNAGSDRIAVPAET